MATPDRNPAWVKGPVGKTELALYLHKLRQEIGALRQELIGTGQSPLTADEENYRIATQIDLLVHKFLRLCPKPPEED